MERHSRKSIELKRPVLAACSGALMLALLVPPCMAAPNQERLDRKPPVSQSLPAPKPAALPRSVQDAPRSQSFVREQQYDIWQKHQHQAAYSDRSYLSATLAREEYAARMAHAVLDADDGLTPRIKEWAARVLRASDRRIDIIRTLLLDMGGTDEKIYHQSESALEEQSAAGRGYTPAARFLIFLFSYCKSSMESAVPALMESPSADVMELALRMLSAQSTFAAEVRAWLQSHHQSDA